MEPIGIGWLWDTHDADMQLAVDWMQGQPKPHAVLDLLACTCPNSCKLPNCVCMASGLKCTDKLSTCENQRVSGESDNSSAKDESYDDEEDNDDF